LLDLATTLGRNELERALNEAQLQRLTTPREVHSVLARSSRHRGAGALTEVLRAHPELTRSEAERRLVALARKLGLPAPRTNARVGRHEVDALWPAERVIALGYHVIRITAWQLLHEPELLAAHLAVALSGARTDLAGPPPADPSPPRRAA
jgi:hypothetical protein